jgi:hypothetical protein
MHSREVLMATTPSPQPSVPTENNGASYSFTRLLRVTSNASLLSGFFILLGFLGVAWALFTLYKALTPWGAYASDTIQAIAPVILLVSLLILQCFAFAVLMQAIAEGLFIIRDIEENTRSHP